MPLLLVRNDITRMTVDAIVNAANPSLLGGGGVDGAIHRAAGPGLLAECRTLGGCKTGEAKLTRGYALPARYVIHTVGPIWRGGQSGEEYLLRSCYRRSLELAVEYGCESVAFPLISSGIYGYPKEAALQVATDAIAHFLADHELVVYLVLFDRVAFRLGGQFGDVESFIQDAYADEEAKRPRNQLSQRREEPRSPLDGDTGEIWTPATPEEAAWVDQVFGESSFGDTEHDAAPAPSYAPSPWPSAPPMPSAAPKAAWQGERDRDLEAMLRQMDESFSKTLLRLIDEKGLTDVQCYKRANVDRKLFSKIRSDPNYKPSKTTAIAFALALELSLAETQSLLGRAGYTLSHSYLFDILIEYCIRRKLYSVIEVNQLLFTYDQALLGS